MGVSERYGGVRAYEAPLAQRLEFLRLTYLHLAGAIFAFVGLSAWFYTSGIGERFAIAIAGNQTMWLLVLGGFVVVGWLASALSNSQAGVGVQYLGLAIYTVAEALIFAPLIFIAGRFYPEALPSAAGLTLLVFAGLTAYVFTTKSDFSYLKTILVVGSLIALGLIVAAVLLGFELGIWFSIAMIALAAGAVLYTTSNVMLHYRTDQYVAASLQLFSAIALLFWYILRLFLGSRR